MTLKSLRLALWVVVGLLIIGVAGALVFKNQPQAGSFALIDDSGKPVTEAVLKGQPTMLFFGFTHCPEVCPTTLADMALWFSLLGEEGRNLKAVFITVDPERDTPEVLKGYVTAMSDRITGLTGSRAEIDKAIKAWNVFAEKVPTEDGDYTMNHTASVFLIDASGAFQGTIAYGEYSDTAVEKLKLLISKG